MNIFVVLEGELQEDNDLINWQWTLFNSATYKQIFNYWLILYSFARI